MNEDNAPCKNCSGTDICPTGKGPGRHAEPHVIRGPEIDWKAEGVPQCLSPNKTS
jgi:hypothetical protein